MFDQLMEILKPRGIDNIEDLNYLEREQFDQMIEIVEQKQITLEDLRFYIGRLRKGIEEELVSDGVAIPQTPEAERKRLFLTARLKNIILIESVLLSPSEAKKYLEMMITQMKNGNIK